MLTGYKQKSTDHMETNGEQNFVLYAEYKFKLVADKTCN